MKRLSLSLYWKTQGASVSICGGLNDPKWTHFNEVVVDDKRCRLQLSKKVARSKAGNIYVNVFTVIWAPPWSNGSVLDYRSLPPVFESRCGHIWRLFHLWLCYIIFWGRSAHLAYHVYKIGVMGYVCQNNIYFPWNGKLIVEELVLGK